MTEVTVSLKDIEALKKSLKPGDKVTYNTPVAEFLDTTNKGSKQIHKAKIVKKLRNLAIIEYNAKRGIYFQRRGCAW